MRKLFIIIFIFGLIAGLSISIWWSIVPIAFFSSFYLSKKSGAAFWAGFFANAFLWLILISIQTFLNNNILVVRMAKAFYLPHWSLLILATILIGGVVSGTSSLLGYFTRRTFNKYI